MNDELLLRYSRQIMLPQFGIEGQQALADARVLIIGVGGLGSPVAMYLAAAGVGELLLVDDDRVELSNLQRQIIHATPDLGVAKVESAAARLAGLNPHVRVTTLARRLDEDGLRERADWADVVVDGSDNFETRFAVNRACVAAKTPLVSGAVIRMEGQVSVFRGYLPAQPCYHCLYGGAEQLEETCAENGVLAPVAGIVGAIQATETLKILAGLGEELAGCLLLIDAARMDFRRLNLRKDVECPVCAKNIV